MSSSCFTQDLLIAENAGWLRHPDPDHSVLRQSRSGESPRPGPSSRTWPGASFWASA